MNEKFPNPSSSTESTQASPEKLSSVISANISSKAEAQELLTADFNKRYEEDEASKRMREDEGYKETEEDVRIENENFVKTKEIESLVLELADKAKVSCEIQLPEEIQPNEAGTATMLPVKVSWNMDGGAEEKNLDIEVLGREPMDVWLPIPESDKETTGEIEAKAWLERLALSKAFDQLTKQLTTKYGNVVVHNQAYY